jgi:hypothetical protein
MASANASRAMVIFSSLVGIPFTDSTAHRIFDFALALTSSTRLAGIGVVA